MKTLGQVNLFKRITLLKVSFLFTLLGIIMSGAIMAENNTLSATIEKRLIPVDDTYTYSYSNRENNVMRGMEEELKTYYSTPGNAVYFRVSFLKFDISSLSPFVESVKFRIFCKGFPAGGVLAHEFVLYPVSKNTWSEDDMTYSNYAQVAGANITSPELGLYVVPQGEALSAQYLEFSGANLTKYVKDAQAAGDQFISIRFWERTSVKAVIVEFHSKENVNGNPPELVVQEKEMEALKASDVRVNGTTIAGFSETIYKYIYQLPSQATEIPVVQATAKYGDVSMEVVQANSLIGSETDRTAKITIQKGDDVLTYLVVFEKLPPPNDARLSDIVIANKSLEFFDIEKNDYTVYLPYTETVVPAISVVPFQPEAITQIVNATSIDPADPESNRTTLLNVTSGDGTATRTYRIVFHRLPELDLFLAIGQSNMAGRASFEAYQDPMEDVYLLTPDGELEIATNPLNKYSNVRKDMIHQKLGPSYSCALKVQEHLQKPIAFVVNAKGGSALSTWYQRGTENYDGTIKRAKEAQRFGKFRAIIWHQGEGDSNNSSLLSKYMERLNNMVESLRSDLNEPDLFFVAGEIAYWRGGGLTSVEFNKQIRTIANHISNSDWISAEGCTPLIDETDPHFDTPSYILLGERYAEKLINGPPTPTEPTKGPFFTDNFNRAELSPGGDPAVTYTVTNSGEGLDAYINSNMMRLTACKTGEAAGQHFVTAPLSAFQPAFKSKLSEHTADSLIWTFNLRHNLNSAHDGFGPGQKGVGVILVADNSDLSVANGYAVVRGEDPKTFRYRLVQFSGGIDANNKLTTIVEGETGTSTNNRDYMSLKVVYLPSTNTWKYYERSDGGSVFSDPLITTGYVLAGSVVDDTHTSKAMTSFGFTQRYQPENIPWIGQFDNFQVAQMPEVLSSLSNPHQSATTYKLYSQDGVLYLENVRNSNMSIYTIDGKLIHNRKNVNDYTTVPLGKGMYLVRIDNDHQKIIIN